MRLLAKLNLLYIVVYGSGLTLAGYLSYRLLQQNARTEVLQQAELMMETTLSTRNYTSIQIKPLLEAHQVRHNVFLPQTVPAFAATETFSYLRKRYPSYTYKEATLNPTNLRDRATDWETDVINIFRNSRDRKEVSGQRETPDGPSLYLAHPIRAAASCLECHSTPSAAPAAMIKQYGTAHGFGWQEGEVIGAQIVSVPMEVPISMARRAFENLVAALGAVGVLTLVILDLALIFVVIRPVTRLSQIADQMSRGDLDVPDLPVSGKDEISHLGASFQRMHVSLSKAMKMLEE